GIAVVLNDVFPRYQLGRLGYGEQEPVGQSGVPHADMTKSVQHSLVGKYAIGGNYFLLVLVHVVHETAFYKCVDAGYDGLGSRGARWVVLDGRLVVSAASSSLR